MPRIPRLDCIRRYRQPSYPDRQSCDAADGDPETNLRRSDPGAEGKTHPGGHADSRGRPGEEPSVHCRRHREGGDGYVGNGGRVGYYLTSTRLKEPRDADHTAHPRPDPPDRRPGGERRIPCSVIAIQSFGDFLGFSPHCHILVKDGCFYGNDMFRVAFPLKLKKLEAIFRHKVFRILLARGKITEEMIAMLSTWRHSGFHVFCGNCISPKNDTAMENLARDIIRVSFSQERIQYLNQEGKVVYASKEGRTSKNFPVLEWLANLSVPNWGEQMVRCYGFATLLETSVLPEIRKFP